MTYNPDIHHRRTIRLKEFDYTGNGSYFVTLCTFQRECLFGEIADEKMRLNDVGEIVRHEWLKTAEIRKKVILDEFVVMPNHFHAIIFLPDNVGAIPAGRPGTDVDSIVTADKNQATQGRATHRVAPTGPISDSVGAIIGQFKSVVTKQINRLRNNPGCPVWQRNYYERVIRNEQELARAREYIVNNPMKWALDKENPVNLM